MNFWRLFIIINRGNAPWRKINIATIFVISIFAIIAIVLAMGIYFGFNRFLQELNATPELKSVVTGYTLQALFLIIFSLSIAGTILISPYLFLKNHDTSFLLTLPLKNTTIYSARFLQQITLSIWTGLIFGVPAIIAINYHYQLDFRSYLTAVILLLILIIIGCMISNILLFLIMNILQRHLARFLILFQIVIIGALGFLITKTISPKALFSMIESNNPADTATTLNILIHHFRFWPSGWYVDISFYSLFSSSNLNYSLICLTLTILVLFALQHLLAHISYRRILQRLQEGGQKIHSSSKFLLHSHGRIFLIIKEWLQIRRTRADFSQFVLFFFIFFIYLGMLFQAPSITESIDPIWTPRLIMFIILTTGYFITLIALRFAFPFTAMEKQSSWYSLTLPLNRCCALGAHIISVFLPVFVIIEGVIILTAIALNLSPAFSYPLMALAPFLTLTSITIAMFFGTIFPVKIKSNSETISTTPAGLGALAACFLYITLSVALLWPEITRSVRHSAIGINVGPYYLILISLSLFIIFLLWKISQRKYNRLYL